MKKLLILCLTILLTLTLTACGGNEKEKSAKSEPAPPPYPTQVADMGDCEMVLYNHEIVDSQKEKGKKEIVFYYHFKNKSDKDIDYENHVNANYEQGDEPFWFSRMSDKTVPVAPGQTYDMEVAYILNDLETPIKISIGGFTSMVPRTELTVQIK